MMRHAATALLLAATLLAALPVCSAYEFDMIFQTKCIFEEVSFESAMRGSYSAFLKDNHDSGVPLSLKIEDPHGHLVLEKQDAASTKFDLPNVIEGEYKLCFTARGETRQPRPSPPPPGSCPGGHAHASPLALHPADYHVAQNTRIALEWREGVEATDWESVAKKENLDSVHVELLRLEEAVHTIHLELQHIRRKEEEMRDVNGACRHMPATSTVKVYIPLHARLQSTVPLVRNAEATNTRVALFSVGALITCIGMAGLQLWSLRKFFIRKKLL